MSTNTLLSVAGGTIYITHPNQYFSALTGDLVTRNASGAPQDIYGSLGSTTYRWNQGYLKELFIGATGTTQKIFETSGHLDFTVNATTHRITSGGHLLIGSIIDNGVLAVGSGTITGSISANGDDGVFINTGHAGLSIISGNTSEAGIYLGRLNNPAKGIITYDNSSDVLIIQANGRNNYFNSGGFATGAAIIDADHIIYGYRSSGDAISRIETGSGGAAVFRGKNSGVTSDIGAINSTTLVWNRNGTSFITYNGSSLAHTADRVAFDIDGESVGNFEVSYSSSSATSGVCRFKNTNSSISTGHAILSLEYTGDSDVTNSYFVQCKDSNNLLGGIYADSATTVALGIVSDVRLKTHIRPLHSTIDLINKINAVTFNWTKDGSESCGVIAQEVEKLFPHIVRKPQNDDDFYLVDYSKFIVPLIKAVQELSQQIKDLQHDN
jgi:hypothetical protein